MSEYDWLEGEIPAPASHEPWCEKFDPTDPDQSGLLPCHCSQSPNDPRWPLDPIIAREFGEDTVDVAAWLECTDDHDPCCPGELMESACLCRLIARVRSDERTRVARWLRHRDRFPDIPVPGAANGGNDEVIAVADPFWAHGDVVIDRHHNVTCVVCGEQARSVNSLGALPCVEPEPLWERYAA